MKLSPGGALLACALLLAACGGSASTSTSSSPGQSTDTGTSTGSRQTATAQPPGPAITSGGDWPTFDYDAARHGVAPGSGITAGNTRTLQMRVVRVDGTVDSSPIQLHAIRVGGHLRDVAVVTTTYGKTIAFDPATGAELWEYTPADFASYAGGAQVTTATPVADPDRTAIYAASPDGFIHKLALASGSPIWSARVTYDATREKIGPALNFSRAGVIVATGGYFGDAGSYQGHVVVLDSRSGRPLHVWNALCSDRHYLIDPPRSCPDFSSGGAAIWARAGVIVEPGSGRLLTATGNGPFNGSTDWGDSVVELTSDATRLLHNWTPTNQAQLASSDADLGSSGPALLPGGLALEGGKNAVLSLLNLNALDGTVAGPSPRLGGELQQIDTPGSTQLFTAPAVWQHGGETYVFVADGQGTSGYVLGSDRRLHVSWRNGTPGTSPVLAGGLLYIYNPNAGGLIVRNPVSGQAVAMLPAPGGHWNSPIIADGRVLLPVGGSTNDSATSGSVYVFHLPGR